MKDLMSISKEETMSIREIAEVLSARPRDIMNSAKLLENRAVINIIAGDGVASFDNQRLNRIDSITLVAQNKPEITKAIVQRWDELENNLTLDQLVLETEQVFKLTQDNSDKDKVIAILKDELSAVEAKTTTCSRHLKLLGIKDRKLINTILDIVTDRTNSRMIQVPKFDREAKWGFDDDVEIVTGRLYDTVLITPDLIESCLIYLGVKF